MSRPGRRRLTAGAALAGLVGLTVALLAQQTLDRTKVPPAGPAPTLHVPVWSSSTLPDGAELRVAERHDLPLVSFTITLLGGADQFETADRRGLASFTAAMMSEGTATRDGEALSNALQLLGTNIAVSIAGESGGVGFLSTTAKFGPTLDILADLLEHPTFPAPSLDRLRAQRLVALAQAKTQPAAMSATAFPRVLYGPAHPFGWAVTEDTVNAITRDDIVAFHKAYFQPGRALITVVGDVTAAGAKAAVTKALAGWPTGGTKPTFAYPAVPAPRPTTIYLVDKPGAAQSTFAVGNPGPPRTTPDYFALQVMNQILGAGANFASRLNLNIREAKGYSYGVRSSFAFGRGPGPFQAGGDIVSDKSSLALVEFIKELRGIQGSRPVTDEELSSAKDSLNQRLPGQFASVAGINAAIAGLWVQGLPPTYYATYTAKVSAVTREDVVRVAKAYIDLDHLAIVIVGDRTSIEGPLTATHIGPVVVIDVNGRPVAGTR